METTLIYFSVKVLSATYILYKVWMFIFSPKVYNFWDSQLRHMRIARIRLWKSRKKRMAEKARKARYRFGHMQPLRGVYRLPFVAGTRSGIWRRLSCVELGVIAGTLVPYS